MSVAHKPRATQTTGGATLGRDASQEARRIAAVLLEVLAGLRTPAQGAEALGVCVPRYYQLESRGLRGLLEACEPKPRGRQADGQRELAALRQHNQRLERDLARQQSLVRLAQRTLGLNPVAATPPAKKSGQKGRRRRPAVRALAVAARLQQPAEVAAAPVEGGPPATPS